MSFIKFCCQLSVLISLNLASSISCWQHSLNFCETIPLFFSPASWLSFYLFYHWLSMITTLHSICMQMTIFISNLLFSLELFSVCISIWMLNQLPKLTIFNMELLILSPLPTLIPCSFYSLLLLIPWKFPFPRYSKNVRDVKLARLYSR